VVTGIAAATMRIVPNITFIIGFAMFFCLSPDFSFMFFVLFKGFYNIRIIILIVIFIY
jgi:hypothetical protein